VQKSVQVIEKKKGILRFGAEERQKAGEGGSEGQVKCGSE